MKKIISTLGTLALAVSLAAPVFAAAGVNGAKGQTGTASTTAKSAAKPAGKMKKSTKPARKTATKTAATSTPQTK
jgi:hypothetical protein